MEQHQETVRHVNRKEAQRCGTMKEKAHTTQRGGPTKDGNLHANKTRRRAQIVQHAHHIIEGYSTIAKNKAQVLCNWGVDE